MQGRLPSILRPKSDLRTDSRQTISAIEAKLERGAAREAVMRRILVVDDDPHVSPAIRARLVQHGFRVAIADGGANGLAALDNLTFDLMIVDAFMPNMRGFESIGLFHQRTPSVPLIAISGYAFSNLDISGADFPGMAAKLGAARGKRHCST
jgi:CheY-like chemotaxis protein